MAQEDIGKRVWFNGEHGKEVGWVADFAANREGGDHLIFVAHNGDSKDAGNGVSDSYWRNEGEGQGTFSFAH